MIFTEKDMPIEIETFDPESKKILRLGFQTFDEWIKYCKKLDEYIKAFGADI